MHYLHDLPLNRDHPIPWCREVDVCDSYFSSFPVISSKQVICLIFWPLVFFVYKDIYFTDRSWHLYKTKGKKKKQQSSGNLWLCFSECIWCDRRETNSEPVIPTAIGENRAALQPSCSPCECCVSTADWQPETAEKRSRSLYGLTTSNSGIPLGEDFERGSSVNLCVDHDCSEGSSKIWHIFIYGRRSRRSVQW